MFAADVQLQTPSSKHGVTEYSHPDLELDLVVHSGTKKLCRKQLI